MKLKIAVRVRDDGALAARCRSCSEEWWGNHFIQNGHGGLTAAMRAAQDEADEHARVVHHQ